MKTIPDALASHLREDATTWCMLLKVSCKGTFTGTVLGFTSLDAELVYNDGLGDVTYKADSGFTPQRVQMSGDVAVDNTDLVGWVSDTGVTEQQIRAGLFDYADVVIYRVNYLSLASGHEVVGAGTCGETIFSEYGWRTEFRSFLQQARQSIINPYSLNCRARFGDSKCGKAFSWAYGEVLSVGADPSRLFISSVLDVSSGQAQATSNTVGFNPGVVDWLTGDNVGAQMDVELHELNSNGESVRLFLDMPYPIQVGDTFRIRLDCTKEFEFCRDVHDNVLNFRGEHLTPVGARVMTPGTSDIIRAGGVNQLIENLLNRIGRSDLIESVNLPPEQQG